MEPILLSVTATDENFNEEAYLAQNPDVANDVRNAISLRSGRQHFDVFGKTEGRHIRLPASVMTDAKQHKLQKIKNVLKTATPHVFVADMRYDFLSDDMRKRYNLTPIDAISSNNYDSFANTIITELTNGLILDCGAGRRDIYYPNVVNFDIVDYDTTDVVGAGEELPFNDNTFDAVISYAVLEHVQDPFKCASEIARVLKPGGRLLCSVPFLQPYHAYPHHYYNMTGQGLSNLFKDKLLVDNLAVTQNELPIWGLTWILRQWANALNGETREAFMQTKIGDLIETGDKYLDKPFVTQLPDAVNRELAYATLLFAHKE